MLSNLIIQETFALYLLNLVGSVCLLCIHLYLEIFIFVIFSFLYQEDASIPYFLSLVSLHISNMLK